MAKTGSRSVGGAEGDAPRVAAPVPPRFTSRPVAANDNRAPLARRLVRPMLAAAGLIAVSLAVYLVGN